METFTAVLVAIIGSGAVSSLISYKMGRRAERQSDYLVADRKAYKELSALLGSKAMYTLREADYYSGVPYEDHHQLQLAYYLLDAADGYGFHNTTLNAKLPLLKERLKTFLMEVSRVTTSDHGFVTTKLRSGHDQSRSIEEAKVIEPYRQDLYEVALDLTQTAKKELRL